MKTALITGANKGIGLEIAKQLAKRNFHVILAGRNTEALESAMITLRDGGTSAEFLVLDVRDSPSIESARDRLKRNDVQLDVLINNAAVLLNEDRSLVENEFHVIEDSVITNAYGPLHAVRAFLSLMRKPSRIINVSSGGGSMADPVGGWSPGYCISKTLLNAITRQLAYELSGKRIAVNAVCPGWVKTDMGGRSAPRSVERGAETPVWLAAEAPATLTGKFFRDKKEIDW